MITTFRPHIVGVGGTTASNSSTEQALKVALEAAQSLGAKTTLIDGERLARIPIYRTTPVETCPDAVDLIQAVRSADGLIIASPGYHGTLSGLIKNALDYLEETARDERVYLDGVPVGLIATAYGWQATGGTMTALRTIVHGLRGWPTPLGAMINTSGGIFQDGACQDAAARKQLMTVGEQVFHFSGFSSLVRDHRPTLVTS